MEEKIVGLGKFVASAGKRSGQLALSALIVGAIAAMGIHSPEELATYFGFTVPITKLLWSFVNLFGPETFWKTINNWSDNDQSSKEILERLEKLELTRKLDDRQFRHALARVLNKQQSLIQQVVSESEEQTGAILLAQFESYELLQKEQLTSIKSHVNQGVITILKELEVKYGSMRNDNLALRRLLGMGIQHLDQELSELKQALGEVDDHIQALGSPLPNQDTSHDPLFWETKKEGPVIWLWGAPLINHQFNVNRVSLHEEIKKSIMIPHRKAGSQSLSNAILLAGMGGVGKTYTARILWEDSEIQQRFPDGVLWASIGQQPNLTLILNEWVAALGGKMLVLSPSLDQYKEALIHLLKDRSCLLIVDDVWEKKHLESFLSGGEKCCIVATSRNRNIAEELNISSVKVPPMNKREGVELLENWAGKNLEESQEDVKEKIIKALGYLPKAIQLSGAQIKHTSAKDWIDSFSSIRDLDLEWNSADPDKSLAAAFKVSLEALEAQKRELFTVLGIFPEGEDIPDEPIFLIWQALVKRITPLQVQNLLKELIDKALIEQTQLEPLQVKLHDLLHDLVLEVLGGKASDYHKALLDAYSETRVGEGWHTAPDDGYLYDHLVFHLDKGGEEDDIKILFNNDAWVQARLREGDFLYRGYTRDLRRAWKISHDQLIKQIEQGEPALAMSECVRYALIQTSTNSLINKYDPVIVELAVTKNVWTVEHALAITEQRSDPKFQLEIFTYLLQKIAVDDPMWRSILIRALDIYQVIENEDKYVSSKSRSDFADVLIGEKALETLRIILEMRNFYIRFDLQNSEVWGKKQKNRSSLAYLLIEHLGKDHIQPALEAILTVEEISILILIIPHLSSKQIQAVLEWALEIDDELNRYSVLFHIADQLDLMDERQVNTLLNEVRNLSFENNQAEILNKLSGRMNSKQVQTSLETSLGFRDYKTRARVINGLSGQLNGDQLQIALSEALLLKDESYINTLCFLSDRLQGKQKISVLQTAQITAQEIPDDEERAFTLYKVAKRVHDNQKHQLLLSALKAAEGIDDDYSIAHLLDRLAADFEKEVFEQTDDLLINGIELVMGMEDPLDKALLLAEWSKPLSLKDQIQYLETAFDEIHNIEDDFSRWEALEIIGRRLDENQIHLAQEIIFQWKNEFNLFAAIQSLIPRFNPDLLSKTLEIAQQLKHMVLKIRLLLALSEMAEDEDKDEIIEDAVNIFKLIQDEKLKSAAVQFLVPFLNKEQLISVCSEVIDLGNGNEQAEALSEIIPHLKGAKKAGAMRAAIDSVKSTPDDGRQVRILEKIIPHVEENNLHEVLLIVADSIGGIWSIYPDSQKSILSQLSESNFRFVLNQRTNINDREYQAWALLSLSKHVTEDQEEKIAEHGLQKIKEILYAPLFPTSPLGLLEKIKNKKIINAFIESPDHVNTKYGTILSLPNLAYRVEAMITIAKEFDGYRRIAVTEEALKTIEQSKSDTRSDLLVSLSPYLVEEQFQTAYGLAIEIQDIRYQTKALSAIANFDENKEQSVIQQSAQNILSLSEKDSEQIYALRKLLPFLDQESKTQVLQSALEISLRLVNEKEKLFALNALIPLLELEQRVTVVQSAFETLMKLKDDSDFGISFWHISSVLEYMSTSQVEIILERTFEIEFLHWMNIILENIMFRLSDKQLVSVYEAVLRLEDIDKKTDLLNQIALQIKGDQAQIVREAALSSSLIVLKHGDIVHLYDDLIDTLDDDELIHTLESVMEMDDCSMKVYALMPLINNLSGKVKSQAIRSALVAFPNFDETWFFVDYLNELIALGLTTAGLEKLSKKTLVNTMWEMGIFNRSVLLNFLSVESLINPDILKIDKKIFYEITKSIIEICEDWHWI